MPKSSLVKKLLIKPGQRMIILNSPETFAEELAFLPEGIHLKKILVGEFDFILLFAKNRQELERLFSKARKALIHDGIFWISYPKKSAKVKTDLSRDILWKMIEKKGLRPVAAASIDDVWSAMRFRPPELVKSKKISSIFEDENEKIR